MTCDRCGGKMAVLSTRTIDSDGSSERCRTAADALLSWYTPDWVGRRRRCRQCGHQTLTAEVGIPDLIEVIRLAHAGDPAPRRAAQEASTVAESLPKGKIKG